MSFFGNSNTTAAAVADVEVADPPTDSVSSMAFSPQGDYLAVGSWDNSVRVYEVSPEGRTRGLAMTSHQGPVLSVCWSSDGTKVFSGSADNTARMLDLQTGASQQVAHHDGAIKGLRFFDSPQGGILVTASWDKTVKYWNLQQAQPIAILNLPERCYALDVVYPLLVVGCAERQIHIVNLTNPTTIHKTVLSPLKWQTRTVCCFNSANGFAVGSIEGRVAMQWIEDKDASSNYSFRCHRQDAVPNKKDQVLVYAVNDVKFHPVHSTVFSTIGSDGTVHFWDRDARTRLKSFDPAPGPISTSCFNRSGTIFAYAVSYDWHKGYIGMKPGMPNKVMLHVVKDDEVKKRTSVKR
ncbi:Poly(A)+ RNA export protein [Punctularia strigosozonata HHB-11173 SS5]|uniref:Poly(A)+ RNA export protein n=1 Tax=Punctularia strigosozonata (strain HHB-11173) TaxID=741275 RepID=UPI0004416271|nr:Poly(A)+ RNA export protein [Punctularia strigosozonata HHB-11173 SS5]EIN09851.1 Poly(A)+ RNA export protein [Punctularia strigosozonata HHB-11173 SS5]